MQRSKPLGTKKKFFQVWEENSRKLEGAQQPSDRRRKKIRTIGFPRLGRVLRGRESTAGNPREVLRNPEDRQIEEELRGS